MDYFPLFARLDGQPCLVVGGGAVAHRKTLQLLKCGAAVTVNAPEIAASLRALAAENRIEVARRAFDPALVEASTLVIAATSDRAVNQAVANHCAQHKRLCNVVDDRELSTAIIPSVIDRSPLVVAISTGGESPVLARVLRQRIEAALPARASELVQWAGRWRDRVKATIATHDGRLRFWQSIIEGPAAQHIAAGRTSAADRVIENSLADDARSSDAARGEAWLVGAGPGDPELITQRGLYFLREADVVMYDRLAPRELLDKARRDAELIDVGKTPGGPSVSQEQINRQLVELVRAGRRVCRLKGGDPFIFGRGGEEITALAEAGLPYQVVPGITAAAGCAAYAGIPLTHRGLAQAVSFVTGHEGEDQSPIDWQAYAKPGTTLVVYMGVRKLADISAALIGAGRADDTPAAIVENGTTAHQRCVAGTLGSIAARAAAASVTAPAVLIVGEVAGLAGTLTWFGDNPAQTENAAAEK